MTEEKPKQDEKLNAESLDSVDKKEINEPNKSEETLNENKSLNTQKNPEPTGEAKKEEKKEDKKSEEKKLKVKKGDKKPKPVVKKTEAIVNGKSLPISTKYSTAICKFIKGKKINEAIQDLERVLMMKKAVPMKGEIAHKKGKIMSGRYPKKASEYFIKLLKSLLANANINEIEEPIIVETVSNIASRPYGRFGRVKRKRTHVTIKAKSKPKKSEKKEEKK